MSNVDPNQVGAGPSTVADVIISDGPEHRPGRASELLQADARDVQAQNVTMERAGAEQITTERLVMNNSGARMIDAKSAQIDRSGILAAKSEKAVFHDSTVVAVSVDEARIVRGNVLLLRAEAVKVEGDAKIGVLAGPACEAVRPLVSVQGAAAFGAVCGLVAWLLGAIIRRAARG
ncbi:MAG: hypothetical protein KC442_20040 [Thermomicrobiales bacterium]|nr:hypothetical protein [Thermomicrobiales bacterium]MCA9880101.1 hypothetical protein [Thermomicrobiales bacterium]